MLCGLLGNSGRCRGLGASGGHPDDLSNRRHVAPCSDVINVLLNILDLDTLALAHVRKRRPILAHFPLKFYYLLDLTSFYELC